MLFFKPRLELFDNQFSSVNSAGVKFNKIYSGFKVAAFDGDGGWFVGGQTMGGGGEGDAADKLAG